MKINRTTCILAGLFAAVSVFAQGQLTFGNSSTSRVLDSRTGAAVANNVALAGLFYSLDLQSDPNPAIPDDGWIQLGTSVAIAPSTSAAVAGLYAGGTRAITGSPAGTVVKFQVRAWSNTYATYGAAVPDPNALRGFSNVMTLTLGGGGTTIPIPAISASVQGFTIAPVPEPSTVVLGLLGGLSALALIRRRS